MTYDELVRLTEVGLIATITSQRKHIEDCEKGMWTDTPPEELDKYRASLKEREKFLDVIRTGILSEKLSFVTLTEIYRKANWNPAFGDAIVKHLFKEVTGCDISD